MPMMTSFESKLPKYPRILGIAPSTTGFGYAVIKDLNVLADWGIKWVVGEKNKRSITKVNQLIEYHEPHVVVLENMSAAGSRRSLRIRNLCNEIEMLARAQEIPVALFTRQQVHHVYFLNGKVTRYDLTKIIAERFPEELGDLLPPKRRAWEVEHPRLALFDAVALALIIRIISR